MNKICTDIPQSKRLIELGIDIKTADMDYIQFANMPKEYDCVVNIDNNEHKEDWIPAWSLSALLDVIPYCSLRRVIDGNWIVAAEFSFSGYMESLPNTSAVDACVEMIITLHEQKGSEQ